jgi:hypothetical protein
MTPPTATQAPAIIGTGFESGPWYFHAHAFTEDRKAIIVYSAHDNGQRKIETWTFEDWQRRSRRTEA